MFLALAFVVGHSPVTNATTAATTNAATNAATNTAETAATIAATWPGALERLQAGAYEEARPLLLQLGERTGDSAKGNAEDDADDDAEGDTKDPGRTLSPGSELPPEYFTARAYLALRDKEPEDAWRFIERGILAERAPDETLLPLEKTQILLSGAKAALVVYSAFDQLDPICMVVHADGEYAVALPMDSTGSRSSWLGDVWPRIPKDIDRLFVVPPFVDGQPVLGFEAEVANLHPDHPLGPQIEVSYLQWSSLLGWSAAPRTRSGDGLVLIGGEDAALEAETMLGGRPRNDPLAAEQVLSDEAANADVLHLMRPIVATSQGLRTGSDTVPWQDVANHPMIADLIILSSDSDAEAAAARAFHQAGARSLLLLPSTLDLETRQQLEQSLYLLLRRGLPRDQIPGTLTEAKTRLWGAGHLPVYALVPKRGLGSLILSWVIFVGTGFVVLRFWLRRVISNPGPTTPAAPAGR